MYGVNDFDWATLAMDESGCPVASVPNHVPTSAYSTGNDMEDRRLRRGRCSEYAQNGGAIGVPKQIPLKKIIPGVGQGAPTVVNSKGGKQSSSPYRCDLLPAAASLHIASILKGGAEKYGDNNWRKIESISHVNHALVHIFSHLHGDTQDDHLGHAACRMVMALEAALTKEKEDSE